MTERPSFSVVYSEFRRIIRVRGFNGWQLCAYIAAINFLINNYLSSLRGRGFRADRSILPQSVGMSQLISYPLSNRCFGRVGRRDRVAQFIQKFDARLQVLIFSQEKPSKLFNRLGATILHGYF